MTYRHGKHDLTSTVASVATNSLLTADPIRVNSWHPNKTSRAGLRYLHSTGRHHAHESLFERKMLLCLDFARAPEVASQPFALTWFDGHRWRHHTPDFMAVVDGHVWVINTRPAALVKPTLIEDSRALETVCLSRGWSYALVTDYVLPAFTAIEAVEAHARSEDRLGYGNQILDLLTDLGPTPFQEVCRYFEGHLVARAILQRLIWQQLVTMDLNRNLEDHSLVQTPPRRLGDNTHGTDRGRR